MPLSKSQWTAIQDIYEQILDLPASERKNFIEERLENKTELKLIIYDLLAAEERAPELLERPAQVQLDLTEALTETFGIGNHAIALGKIVGAFKLRHEIGRGGTGSVYIADRYLGDFEQVVAIKISHHKAEKEKAHARFQREQQLLASLNHPNIAKLYDGGITEDGYAWLSMEYIDGTDILEHCRTHHLKTNEKLRLILQVIDAVYFAHQHLVIHRDLKPSNILVKKDGTVKLLDFSIAKLDIDTEAHDLTHDGLTPMTPSYAAPEQLQNSAITVATDIYQLGLVTYELLTEHHPFKTDEISLEALIRKVCNDTPAQPSRANSAHINTALNGDIDAIVLKMLQTNPDDRYASMLEIKRDFIAHWEHRPVAARSASWYYYTQRWLRRYWKFASISSAFLFLVLGYAFTSAWQAKQIELALAASEHERMRAEQVSDFLVKIFNSADPNLVGFDEISAKELLVNGEKRILDDLKHVPDIRNKMLNVLALIWQRQGDYEHALKILKSAQTAAIDSAQTDTPAYAKTLSLIGLSELYTGQGTNAMTSATQAKEVYDTVLAQKTKQKDDEYAYTTLIKAQVLNAFGRHEEAIPLVNEVIQILETYEPRNDEYLVFAYSELALVEHMFGSFTSAQLYMKNAGELQKQIYGVDNTTYTSLLTNLAIIYGDTDQLDAAESAIREVLSIHKKIFEEDNIHTLHALTTAASIFHWQGMLNEAEQMYRQVADTQVLLNHGGSVEYTIAQLRLATVLMDMKKYGIAETIFLDITKQINIENNKALIGRLLIQKGKLAYSLGNFDQSKILFREASDFFDSKNLILTEAWIGLAMSLVELGLTNQALPHAKKAYEMRESKYFSNHSALIEAKLTYALVSRLVGQNNYEQLLNDSLEAAKQSPRFSYGTGLALYRKATETL